MFIIGKEYHRRKLHEINQLTYIGHHFEQGKDKHGNQRRIIVFHLAISDLINQLDESMAETKDFKTNDLQKLKKMALYRQKTQTSTISERKVIYH